MGFRNPFRIQVDSKGIAYITDYSPDSQIPQTFRGPQGTGRVEVVRAPSNYAWPLCMTPNVPYYQWNFNTSTPLDPANPQAFECDNPAKGPDNTSRWNTGQTIDPTVAPGRVQTPRADPAGHLVLVPRQPGARRRARRASTPTTASAPTARSARSSSPSCSRAASDRTAPRRTSSIPPTRARRSSRRTTTGRRSSASSRRTPCVRSGSTRATRCSRSTRSSTAVRCSRRRSRSSATTRWTSSSGPTGTSTCSPTATASSRPTPTPACTGGSTRRARSGRVPSVSATPRNGQAPLTVAVQQRGLARRGPGRLDHVRLGLRQRRDGRLDGPEPAVHATPPTGSTRPG